LIAYGTALHLYGDWAYYDKVVHSLSPMAYSPVIYIALVRLGVVPDPGVAIRERRVPRIAGIFIITLAVGMAVGGFYENIEWLEDKWNILGGHFVKGLWDTETDLLCDTGGSLAGATFLTVWALRGWSSRRIPGDPPAGEPTSTAFRAVRDRLEPTEGSARAGWRRRFAGIPLAAKGLAGIAAGTLLLVWPSPTLRAVGVVFGLALLVQAALDVVETVRSGVSLGRAIQIGIEVAVAVLLLASPGLSRDVLTYVIGAASVIFALTEAASLATGAPSSRDRWLGGAASAAALVFGIAILGLPSRSFDAVITVLGLYLVVLGALQLVRALAARASPPPATRSPREP